MTHSLRKEGHVTCGVEIPDHTNGLGTREGIRGHGVTLRKNSCSRQMSTCLTEGKHIRLAWIAAELIIHLVCEAADREAESQGFRVETADILKSDTSACGWLTGLQSNGGALMRNAT